MRRRPRGGLSDREHQLYALGPDNAPRHALFERHVDTSKLIKRVRHAALSAEWAGAPPKRKAVAQLRARSRLASMKPGSDYPLDLPALLAEKRALYDSLTDEAREYVGWTTANPAGADEDRVWACFMELAGLVAALTALDSNVNG